MQTVLTKKIQISLRWIFSLLSFYGFSQVGINTTNPRTTLEVAGDTYIDGAIKVNGINHIQDFDEASFLAHTGTQFIKELDAGPGNGHVIAYFQEYRLRNMLGDWVEEFDTKIDSEKYVLTIISAYFNLELEMDDSAKNNFAIPYASTFKKGNTWRIVADYPSASKVGREEGVWMINTLIMPKDFSKELPTQAATLSGNNTQRQGGAAQNPVIK